LKGPSRAPDLKELDMGNKTFRGKVSVRHAATGYSVKFEPGTETDAHDLGHALAAIMATYHSKARGLGCPQALMDSMYDDILSGIACGLEHNPVPLNERN
jgi:hypothetical protein